MKLIKEINESVDFIVEGVGKEKQHYIQGIFLQSAIKNRNGRMYPESVMDKEVNRYITEKVNKNSAYGEMTHPESPTVDLKNVSHLITSLTKEGTNWIGKARILDTPMGNVAKGILNGGGRLGVSSRAMGSLKMNTEGVNIVQNDFMLSTAADIVHEPSGIDCWVNGIMENAEWIYEATSDSWKLAEQIKTEFQSKTAKQLAEVQARHFRQFLNNIR
jgi:hypothetical protein